MGLGEHITKDTLVLFATVVLYQYLKDAIRCLGFRVTAYSFDFSLNPLFGI